MSRKTILTNLAYDDQRRLYYVTFNDGSDGHGHRRRHTRTFRSFGEAEVALRRRKADPRVHRAGKLPHRVQPPDGSCTFGEWLSWWLEEDVASDRTETTVYAYRNITRSHVLPALGAIPQRRLSPMRIQTYLYDKMDEGLSSNTVLKYYILLTTALQKAERMELLPVNPMERVSPPKKEATKYTFYSPEQMRALFDATQGTVMELAVKLAAYLGLRRSEI